MPYYYSAVTRCYSDTGDDEKLKSTIDLSCLSFPRLGEFSFFCPLAGGGGGTLVKAVDLVGAAFLVASGDEEEIVLVWWRSGLGGGVWFGWRFDLFRGVVVTGWS